MSNIINIFDTCFSPKTYIVGNNLMNTITLYLEPFANMSKLNPIYVRNMCKDVYFDTQATVKINFVGKLPLTSAAF